MEYTRYIGARYVPKFANPIEWNKALSYEPLTIVQYLGNSFTSKKPVPAGVEITDTTYWANTGNYNEQVAEYQRQVVDLSKEVDTNKKDIANLKSNDTLHDSKLTTLDRFSIEDGHGITILIGDSYLEGWTPDGNVKSWGDYLADILGLEMGDGIFKYYRGGTGFVSASSDINFLTLLDNAGNDNAVNKNEVSRVVVFGGANDGENDLSTALKTFTDKAKAYFPNAVIYIAYNGAGINDRCSTYVKLSGQYWLSNNTKLGYVYVPNVTAVLQDKTLFSSDIFHPNADGQKAVAGALYNAIWHNAPVMVSRKNQASTHNSRVVFTMANNLVTVWFYNQPSIAITISDVTLNGKETASALSTDDIPFFFGRKYLAFSVPCVMKRKTGTFVSANCNVTFNNDVINFMPAVLNDTGTGWCSANDFSEMLIIGGVLNMDYIYA